MNKEYFALFFAIAALFGAYFQYMVGKSSAYQGKRIDSFFVFKIITNILIAVMGLLFFLKSYLR